MTTPLSEITRDEAANRIEAAARDGRLIPTYSPAWNEGSGVLAVVDPRIERVEDCPAHVMPGWTYCVIACLFRELPRDRANYYGIRFADALRRGCLDDSVRNRLLVDAVEVVVEYATPAGAASAHWDAIQAVCTEVCSALRTDATKDEFERLHSRAKEMYDRLKKDLPRPVVEALLAAQIAARPERVGAVAGAMASSVYAVGQEMWPAVSERLLDILIKEMLLAPDAAVAKDQK